jgi:phage recombination protein Bet
MSAVVEFQENKSLIQRMANRFGVDANKMLATLKATAFKGDVSNEQMMALLVVAEQYKLNPWTKEIYAFPDRSGIVPVVGVDGWARIINERPELDGIDFNEAEDGSWIECIIYRKDRAHPTKVKEWLAECKRGTQPWQSHPRRMLRHKALIQCARVAFGFGGIYDQDEAERIIEAEPDQILVTAATRVDPRGDTSNVSDMEEMEHVAAITDLLNQDKDEYGIAADLRAYEAEFLNPFPERYMRVLDSLAKSGVIKKGKFKEYLKIGLDRGETHTA